ncbi:MAG: hypothetical protein QNI84_07905 [Henriciella sp.]|nr:hypothetical protein [Henriciella sp.]
MSGQIEPWPLGLFPVSQTLHVLPAVARFVSPFTATTQIASRARGERWVCEMSFQRLNARQAGAMDALLARLQGGAVKVRVPAFRRVRPSGAAETVLDADQSAPGQPFLDGSYFSDGTGWIFARPVFVAAAAVGARTLTLTGWIPGGEALAPGDLFELQTGRLHMYKGAAPVRADETGAVTIAIDPPLREAVAEGQSVALNRAGVTMRLVDPTGAANPTVKPQFSDYSLVFEEDPT